MQNNSNSTIVRSSLGQILSLGDLYDARKDTFAGINIFNQTPPDTSILCHDNPFSKVDFEITDRLSEKFRKLDVNAELQLSVLAGLVNLQGSGNYLREEKSSAKAERITLLYSIKTKSESLNIFNSNLKEIIDLNAIDCVEATHIVVGIDWGANCTITAEDTNQNNEESTKIQGLLKAEMNKISYAINGQGESNIQEVNNEYNRNFSFRSNCDIVPKDEELPSNLQQAIEFVKKLTRLVRESNNGKGKPLSYTLLPISSVTRYFNFEKKIDNTLQELQEEAVLKFVQLFDEISLIRQELYDIYQDIILNSFCLLDHDLQKVTELKNNFSISEANLRSDLNKTLVEVRSGKSDVSKLDELIKKYEESEFSITKIRYYFQSFNLILEKIKHIKILIKKGINYIGKADSLENQYLLNQNQEVYVLFFAWSNKDNELWKENLRLFMSLLNVHNNDKEKNQFIIVDCDLKSEYNNNNPRVAHFVNGQLHCEDILKKNKADANLCLAQSNHIEDCIYQPNKRTQIKLRCPGSLNGGNCENLVHQWLCSKCREPLEYGFDGYFYCSCGKSKNTAFQYRCNSEKHGSTFISYPENSLNAYLSMMRPLEEMNILILGETGVGKSTWINAFANYVMYQNLPEAEQKDLICVISSSFVMTDDNYQEKRIIIGQQDSNESSTVGQSATQEPKPYKLICGDKIIRLIDTPGIGDTRGIEQDKENMSKILAFLSNYDEIHGICILLKPNNARLNVMFKFCIKELLTHLHRSASQNIVFCFTNARSTFYKPGDSLPPLKKLLEENPDVEISLSKQTIYCMDNESFRFLAALKNGVAFDEKDRQDYSASWNRSVEETARLLRHIASLKPHKVKDTLTLNDARRLIVNLSRPIAEITKNIQININILEDKKNEIKLSEESIKELMKKLKIPKIDIDIQPLTYPTTVCTSPTCVEVISVEDGSKRHYKKRCHEKCSLTQVAIDEIGHPDLKGCAAMDSNKNCRECGCPWWKHMHITYQTYPIQKEMIDSSVQTQIQSKKDGELEIQKFIQNLDTRIKQYEKEKEIINEASAKFACFLKQNAIAPYNDALAAYLDHLIHEEEQKVGAGASNQTLLGLQKTKREYDEQVKILDNAMKQGGDQTRITPDEIKQLEQDLLNLELTGENLRKISTQATVARSNIAVYSERQIRTRNPKKSDGFISDLTNAVMGTGNVLWNIFNSPQ